MCNVTCEFFFGGLNADRAHNLNVSIIHIVSYMLNSLTFSSSAASIVPLLSTSNKSSKKKKKKKKKKTVKKKKKPS
jgi:hypothetical protein